MRDEFDLIASHFAPLAAGAPGSFALGNDAAVLAPPPGRDLVTTVDTLVEGVHYMADDPADLVARKLLRVNLSDLAAMGAEPIAYLLSVALGPRSDEVWLRGFAAGLAEDQRTFGIHMLGGDTVRTPGAVTLTVTALGSVAAGEALPRDGARAGDLIYLSGTLGDGALGLLVCGGRLDLPEPAAAALRERYRLPQPRTALGPRLCGVASACLDVSDGLVADLGHIAGGAGLGAEVEVAALPLSAAGRDALRQDPALLPTVLTGGDDYELLFTVAAGRAGEVEALASDLGLALTRIGRMTEGEGVRVRGEDGEVLALDRAGWRHF